MQKFWELIAAFFIFLLFLGILILINNHLIVIDPSLQHLSSLVAFIFIVAGISAFFLLLGFRELPRHDRVSLLYCVNPASLSPWARLARVIKISW